MAKHKDTRGFYRALRVSTDAPDDEIRLSYALLKQNFPEGSKDPRWLAAQKAYDILKVPARRKEYDAQQSGGTRLNIKIKFDLNSPKLLVACGVALVAVFVLVWYPLYGARLRSFTAGDRLVMKGQPFGTVVQVEEMHPFPSGITGPGYLIENETTKQLQWYPALDLQGTCRKSD